MVVPPDAASVSRRRGPAAGSACAPPGARARFSRDAGRLTPLDRRPRLAAMSGRHAGLTVVGVVMSASLAHAEEPRAANSVFVEIVGAAPVASLNYERLLAGHAGLRAGVGYLRATSVLGNDLDRVEIPVVLGVTLGAGANRLELGAGAVPGILTTGGSKGHVETPVTAVVGYRHCRPEGGFLFRLAFTPLYDGWDASWSGNRFIPLGGASFGYAF
jgi:hypothetical protein